MKFHFGMHLDGWRSLVSVMRFAEMTGGLQFLLSQLELRLGIPSPRVSHASRVVCYLRALEQADCPERFYHDSLQKDPLAVADSLLLWRDELILGGWEGQALPEGSLRLQDLTQVEMVANEQLATGPGDRAQNILRNLEGAKPPLEVCVLDDKAHLPAMLVRLLEALDAQWTGKPLFPLAADGTNLRLAQEALLGNLTGFHWNQSDDSLQLFTAFSEVTLAGVAAQGVIEANDGKSSTLLLDTSPTAPLVSALRESGAPVPSSSRNSVHRPILQLLGLALRLCWGPLNPQHLLEFLVHPVSPLPGSLRRKLAQAVAEQPGIGGPAWREALAQQEQASESAAASSPKADQEALVKLWLEGDRFGPSTGAPSQTLISVCERIRDYATRRAHISDDTIQQKQWHLLVEQSRELAALLAGYELVPRPQLDRLLQLVQGAGIDRNSTSSELGSIPSVSHPGAVLEPIDELFWWCAEQPSRIASSPWTCRERAALATVGIHLVPIEAILNAQHLAYLQPLLATRQRARLFLPRQRSGAPVEHHPLLDALQVLAGDPIPTCNADAMMTTEAARLRLDPVAPRALPKPQRWWKLPTSTSLAPRPHESFSSLEKFIYQPFAWVLEYHARLRQGAVGIFHIEADRRQRGNLMHRLTERLFMEGNDGIWQSATKEFFSEWLDQQWHELLKTEAANLLLPGMKATAERIRQECHMSLWGLIQQLREAGVVRVRADVQPPALALSEHTAVVGRIDLLVQRASSPATAVLDLKYGGFAKREKELTNNTPLQLAIYSRLALNGGAGAWPEVAYYILSKGKLLAQNRAFFPQAQETPSQEETSGPESCWGDFHRVWWWRKSQLSAGWIEVPVMGTHPTDGSNGDPSSVPPDPRWAWEQDAPRYDDFQALTGWEENQ